MSAQPSGQQASDLVNVEIDGQKLQAPKGSMIIQAADKAGIQIPRFCYHDKLAIAANCRMCLVDVEKAPKPMPACATPIMEGMKVYTRSKRALDSQRNVMEFLLVNHPLDCPICDQGGECELQDVAMGYGRSVSRYAERKRVVADEDLGPLVATEMTRCIHCTRCVRFTDDIAGTTELGGMFRGEHTEIGTYIGRSLRSELSGNIIDLCPVGALTNKVFRFRARPWELVARESIGYHDSIGSNLYLHLRRGEVLRSVPRDNEALNENWLSDRDRFSHQGLTHEDRLTVPQIKRDGKWVDVSWEEAIKAVSDGLRNCVSRHGADQLATIISPSVSTEELYLAQAITRGLGSPHIDHRLQQLDFSDDAARPIAPSLGAPLSGYQDARALLLVGSHPRHDAPILGHRIRRAWKHGAQIHAVNPLAFEHHFSLSNHIVGDPGAQIASLAAVAVAVAERAGVAVPAEISIRAAGASDAANAIAASLLDHKPSRVLFGDHAARHPAASVLRRIAQFIATHTGSVFDELPAGANGAAAWRVGAVPHRGPAGTAVAGGLNTAQQLQQPRQAYLLYGAEAPEDFAHGATATSALSQASFVVSFAAFKSDVAAKFASVRLPIGLTPEVDGTYINADGTVQRIGAGAKLPGDARPGWRVLRALGESLALAGFEFTDLTGLHQQMQPLLAADSVSLGDPGPAPEAIQSGAGLIVQRYLPIYSVDAVVRRSPALQATVLAESTTLKLHPDDARMFGIDAEGPVQVGNHVYQCASSGDVPKGVCRIVAGTAATAALPTTGQRVQLTQVSHG